MDESEAERIKSVGNSLLKADDLPGSLAAYTRALALCPPSSQDTSRSQPSLRAVLLSNRSLVHGRVGDLTAARNDADELVAAAPTWFKVLCVHVHQYHGCS